MRILRLFLIKKGFNSKSADAAIRTYRETMSIVIEESQGYNAPATELPARLETSRIAPTVSQKQAIDMQRYTPTNSYERFARVATAKSEAYSESLHYRISGDCKVTVLFDGRVTREAILKLIAHLQLGIDDFPSSKESEESAGVTVA